jgi:hypothetical protein
MRHLHRTVIATTAAVGLLFGGVARAQDVETEPTLLPYDTPEECEANGGTFALFMGCRDAEEYAAFAAEMGLQPAAEPTPEGPAPAPPLAPAQPEPATQAPPHYTG